MARRREPVRRDRARHHAAQAQRLPGVRDVACHRQLDADPHAHGEAGRARRGGGPRHRRRRLSHQAVLVRRAHRARTRAGATRGRRTARDAHFGRPDDRSREPDMRPWRCRDRPHGQGAGDPRVPRPAAGAEFPIWRELVAKVTAFKDEVGAVRGAIDPGGDVLDTPVRSCGGSPRAAPEAARSCAHARTVHPGIVVEVPAGRGHHRAQRPLRA